MKRVLIVVTSLLLSGRVHPADIGEQSRWRAGGQGWWLAPGRFTTNATTDPWFGTVGVASNGLTQAITNGVRAVLFDGSTAMYRVPSDSRFNFGSRSDPWTVFVDTNFNRQGSASSATHLYQAHDSLMRVWRPGWR